MSARAGPSSTWMAGEKPERGGAQLPSEGLLEAAHRPRRSAGLNGLRCHAAPSARRGEDVAAGGDYDDQLVVGDGHQVGHDACAWRIGTEQVPVGV